MAKQVIDNGESGLSVRQKLNQNFTELYDLIAASGFGAFIAGLTVKNTPVDADGLVITDSAAGDAAKKVTWANIKATIKTYTDTLYATIAGVALKADLASPALTGTPAAPTAATSTNTTQLATTAFVQQEINANGLAYTPADELTEIAGLTLETDITAAQLLSALGIITYVTIHADAVTGLTLTNHANSETALAGDSKSYTKFDTQLLSSMRLFARVFTTSASANNPRLYIQYSTNGGSSYTTLGAGTIASGDAISLFTGATTVQVTNWITLPSEAKAADLIWRIAMHGGDGAADPVVGNIIIQCKY
jgi:hypothetical protein